MFSAFALAGIPELPAAGATPFTAAASSVLAGSFDTVGGQGVLSGMSGAASFQLAGYHFETDGVRANNDDRKSLYSGLVQLQRATVRVSGWNTRLDS